jgi:hypothetical protein
MARKKGMRSPPIFTAERHKSKIIFEISLMKSPLIRTENAIIRRAKMTTP